MNTVCYPSFTCTVHWIRRGAAVGRNAVKLRCDTAAHLIGSGQMRGGAARGGWWWCMWWGYSCNIVCISIAEGWGPGGGVKCYYSIKKVWTISPPRYAYTLTL